MKQVKYCLDTHPLIWYFTRTKTLSLRAKSALDEIFSGKAHGVLSVIVLLEIFHFSLKYPNFNFREFLLNLKKGSFSLVSLDAVILKQSYELPKNLEIHDRIIAATSLVTKSVLVTKDPVIRKLRTVKTIW